MFTRKIISLAAGAFLVAGAGLGAITANAGSNAGVCTVDGSVTVTPGPQSPTTPAAGVDNFAFSSTTITCHGTAPIDGVWSNVTAAGTATSNAGGGETCAEATGGGNLTGGSNGNWQIQPSSTFTFKRAAAAVHVTGTIVAKNVVTSATVSGTFTSDLSFVPTSGGCAAPPTTGDTHADMHGTAIIENVA